MAALAYPITRLRPQLAPDDGANASELGTVVRLPLRRRKGARRRLLLRRLSAVAPATVVLAAVWFGSGLVSGAGSQSPLRVLPGSVATAGGYRYVVQPGDTVWSIASRLEPGHDPRPLVDELDARWGGTVLHPGEQLTLP